LFGDQELQQTTHITLANSPPDENLRFDEWRMKLSNNLWSDEPVPQGWLLWNCCANWCPTMP
jgi:hypothetical protein